MKHEKGKSEFEILVSKPTTFQTVGRYSKALALIESLKLSREVSSIRSRQALDWQIFITEHEGPLYAAVLEGCMFAKTAASFELSSINMSLETLGKIMRERKPQTFEEAKSLVDEYIYFYNNERIQQKTGQTPMEVRYAYVA